MSEHYNNMQRNVNYRSTFNISVKAPAVANRIFDTLDDAQNYVDDLRGNATEGIRITVLKDSNPDNNGVYYVKTYGGFQKDGQLVHGELIKICRGNAAWYKGNAVSSSGSTYFLKTAEPGDMYLNTQTLDMYTLLSDGTWQSIGNMSAVSVNKDIPYYILSVSGTEHPDFNTVDWSEGVMPTNYEGLANNPDYNGQVFMWTRFYDTSDNNTVIPRYVVSMVYSSLNLGTFDLENQ